MLEQHVERRPAAILAADVAGYSRLTGADEEGTITQLRVLRKDVVDPTISTHHGHIVKTTGDGMLVEFASVVDAAWGDVPAASRSCGKVNGNVSFERAAMVPCSSLRRRSM